MGQKHTTAQCKRVVTKQGQDTNGIDPEKYFDFERTKTERDASAINRIRSLDSLSDIHTHGHPLPVPVTGIVADKIIIACLQKKPKAFLSLHSTEAETAQCISALQNALNGINVTEIETGALFNQPLRSKTTGSCSLHHNECMQRAKNETISSFADDGKDTAISAELRNDRTRHVHRRFSRTSPISIQHTCIGHSAHSNIIARLATCQVQDMQIKQANGVSLNNTQPNKAVMNFEPQRRLSKQTNSLENIIETTSNNDFPDVEIIGNVCKTIQEKRQHPSLLHHHRAILNSKIHGFGGIDINGHLPNCPFYKSRDICRRYTASQTLKLKKDHLSTCPFAKKTVPYSTSIPSRKRKPVIVYNHQNMSGFHFFEKYGGQSTNKCLEHSVISVK